MGTAFARERKPLCAAGIACEQKEGLVENNLKLLGQ